MSPRRLIILGLALVAAIVAWVLVRGASNRPAATAQAVKPIAGMRVLVAAKDVAFGAPLQASDLEWKVFPDDTPSANFVTEKSAPDAQTALVGAVARRPFLTGEPIISGEVMKPDDRGSMAAVLEPGYRAVSVHVDTELAAGGFIQPGDHVDVMLTTRKGRDDEEQQERVRTDIVLQDVRVLALGDKVQPAQIGAQGPERLNEETVLLELSANDARALQMANSIGKLSLALRGVETEPPGLRTPSSRRGSAIDQVTRRVRIHAFGNVRDGGA